MKTAKNSRQERILALIRDNDISTQEDLTAKVNQAGFEATQATISRDIKELKVFPDKNIVRAEGFLNRYIGSKRIQKSKETYEVKFKAYQGRLFFKEIKRIEKKNEK